MDTIDMMERAMKCFGSGDVAGAESLCRQVLQEEVDNPDAQYLLGVIEHKRGQYEKAEELIESAIKVEGRAFWYYVALAEVRSSRGNLKGAVEALKEAIRIQPDQPPLYDAVAKLLARLGRTDEQIEACRALAHLLPNNPVAFNNLGAALLNVQRSHDAVAAYQRAVELNPNSVDSQAGLAVALADDMQPDAAFEAAAKATALAPDDAYTHYTNGVVLASHKQYDRAVAAFELAIAKDPNHIEARRRLAHLLAPMGELHEAMTQWREVTKLMPEQPTAHHNLLFSYNYLPDMSVQEVFEAHQKWGQKFADPWLRFVAPHANTPEPQRKLRVGYLSADLRYHAVSMFFRPILQHHDDEKFETICFSGAHRVDDMTRALRDLADGWHVVAGFSNEHVAELIRHEGIDILVDLGGHTKPALLEVFSLKPAPVQFSYLGYCNTSGMSAFDHVVGDDITDPPNDTQPYVEQLLRLPGCFSCYGAIQSAPAINELPALSHDYVTLASFNTLQKINHRVLDLWTRILNEMPNTRLLLWRDRLTDRERARLLAEFAQRGIGEDRLILRREIPADDNMKLTVYHEADVGLDAFPWSGHTTSCNSLWMGVPYVTLRWPNHAGRMAASAITHAGFPQWVAENEDQCVQIVRELISDLPKLAELRRTIRQQMTQSTLCDGRQFTLGWEAALRGAWRKWCAVKREQLINEVSAEANRGLR